LEEKKECSKGELKERMFKEILEEIWRLHLQKGIGHYGTKEDPFNNLSLYGFIGTIIRINDKIYRLNNVATTMVKENRINIGIEKIEDTLLDLATYAIIALIQFRLNEYGCLCENE